MANPAYAQEADTQQESIDKRLQAEQSAKIQTESRTKDSSAKQESYYKSNP